MTNLTHLYKMLSLLGFIVQVSIKLLYLFMSLYPELTAFIYGVALLYPLQSFPAW